MKLKTLRVRAFRGFGQEQTFDLDSPIVLLTGANGRGKTSFFDAIQWALLGKLPRLTGSRDSQGNDYIGNAFAVPSEPFVELVTEHNDREVVIQRTGARAALRVQVNGQSVHGPEAWGVLQETLLIHPMDDEAVYQHLTRTHLLEQETLLDFLRSDRPTDRFRMFSKFLGLGVIRDKAGFLQEAVRYSGEKVSVATRLLQAARNTVTDTKGKLESARASVYQSVEQRDQKDLLDTCRSLLLEIQSLTDSKVKLPGGFSDILPVCKNSVAMLTATMDRWHSDQARLTELRARSRAWETLVNEQQELQAQLEEARVRESAFQPLLTEAKSALDGSAQALEMFRKQMRHGSEGQTQLAKFLEEGLKLASGRDKCPLCDQFITYSDLARHVDGELQKLSRQARQLADQQKQAEGVWNSAKQKYDELIAQRDLQARRIAETLSRISGSALSQLTADLRRLNIIVEEGDELGTRIEQRAVQLGECLTRGNQLRDELEKIAVVVDAIGRSQLIRSLEHNLVEAEKAAGVAENEHAAITRAQQQLQLLFRKVQAIERDLVEELLQRYEPVWQEFYYRIQPHPLFTRLRLKLSQGDERGVFFEAVPEGDGDSKRANMIFSGGQSAGLMVVLFLTLHLHQNWTHLGTVMLDDPLQNMDDLNVLGLVDLLRFFGEHRQVVLSTHDERFAGMLLHKFRSLEPNQRIIRYAFEGLTRMGPVIRKEISTTRRAAREAMYLTRLE